MGLYWFSIGNHCKWKLKRQIVLDVKLVILILNKLNSLYDVWKVLVVAIFLSSVVDLFDETPVWFVRNKLIKIIFLLFSKNFWLFETFTVFYSTQLNFFSRVDRYPLHIHFRRLSYKPYSVNLTSPTLKLAHKILITMIYIIRGSEYSLFEILDWRP